MAIVADRITFRAGLADDVALAEVPVLQTAAPERFGASNPITVQDHLRDAALLRLAKPVPTSLADPFVVVSPGTGDEVSVVFSRTGTRRRDVLAADLRCSWPSGWLYRGRLRVGDGSSGAPVPAAGDYGARIVSIISAGTRDGDGTIACGMELPTLAADHKARPPVGIPKKRNQTKDGSARNPAGRYRTRWQLHRGALCETLTGLETAGRLSQVTVIRVP